MHFYKVIIYGQLRGYVAASNVNAAKKKVVKDSKYKTTLFIGKSGKPTNLKLEKVI